MITIVGWLWQQEKCAVHYEIEHANVWARMIHRNLTAPHRIVIMTDYPEKRWKEFDETIEPKVLWPDWRDLKTPRWKDDKPQCYVRLKAFSEEAIQYFGPRFASVDLDCVVTDNLDPIFVRKEPFLIWHRPIIYRNRPTFNDYVGSLWLMTAGAKREVWEDFKGIESVELAKDYLGSDQAWIRYRLGPGEPGWTEKDGVYSFVTHVKGNPLAYGPSPPPGSRIIFFQGGEKPWHYLDCDNPRCSYCGEIVKVNPPWLLRRNAGPVKNNFQWIAKYWH